MKSLWLPLILVCGCGSALNHEAKAREALSVIAIAGARADDMLAREYTAHAKRELEQAASFADYGRAMHRYDKAVDATRTMRLALLAAESALDALVAGDDAGEFMTAMGCVREATERLVFAFDAAGLKLPKAIDKALAALSVAPICRIDDAQP